MKGSKIFTMPAITFDGLKYANVRLDLVRSSRHMWSDMVLVRPYMGS